jgi:hypothetical protein
MVMMVMHGDDGGDDGDDNGGDGGGDDGVGGDDTVMIV